MLLDSLDCLANVRSQVFDNADRLSDIVKSVTGGIEGVAGVIEGLVDAVVVVLYIANVALEIADDVGQILVPVEQWPTA